MQKKKHIQATLLENLSGRLDIKNVKFEGEKSSIMKKLETGTPSVAHRV